MGTACIKSPTEQKPNQKNNSKQINRKNFPNFTANIRELHQQYVKDVLHVRYTKLFASKTDQLINAIHQYFKNQFKYNKNDLNIRSIDSVRKLHPKQYWQGTITEQWLIDACLRQQKFSDQTKVQLIGFDHAFPAYVNFLRLCRYNFIQKNGAIAVPSKCQDVIWHSHMQDPYKYKADMIEFMGKLLNHMDDIPDQQLKKHSDRTQQLQKQLKNKPMVVQNTSKQYPNQKNINPIKN